MLALLFAAFATGAAVPPAADSLTNAGVSLALAEYRAQRVRDVRYELALDVTAADTAVGRVTMRFTARRTGDVIVDFRGPALSLVRVNGKVLSTTTWNGMHLRIPAALVRKGANRLDMEFRSLIAAAGASIIRVRDPSDNRTYLYTLLVPSDANQLFPCFDQPDLKARVSLTLVTPLGWKAVANGTRLRADSTSRGTTHLFRESEPISTYLIAFAAGPWAEFTTKATRRPITLYVRRSRVRDVDADSILVANDRAATWLEGYFGSRFPFQKLDVVLAPAFPFGGMEHPGAIFYSEERFVYRERPTRQQLLGRASTIYHEVAHQWFGDLVTMKWFDDLWLKEGFATYMGAKMQAALDTASQAWKTFYLRNKPVAYQVDMTDGTTPIWQQLGNLDQAKSNYGAIVYNKAPGVLKQLNFVVGEPAFRAGVRSFLKAHAYANATWRDLLDAIGTAATRPLRAWGDDYILRPGMPVLEQRVETRDGRVSRVTIVQHPARPLSGARPWPIRGELMVLRDAAPPQRLPLSITTDTTVVEALTGTPVPSLVYANADDNAYALVLLDPASAAFLERGIGKVTDPFLRAQLWGALWDLVREAWLAPDRYVRLAIAELPRESDEQIVASILSRLTRATTAYLGRVSRDAYLPDIERLLLVGMNDTSRSYDVRKAYADAFVRVATTPPALANLESLLDSASLAGAPLRAPTRWSIVQRLVATGALAADRRLESESARDSSPEGLRRAFVVRAGQPDPAIKRAYFGRYFNDAALNEDWATSSLDAFNAVEAQALTRPFLRAALDSLPWIQKNRRIFYLGSWLGSFLEGQTDAEALEIVRGFLEQRPDLAPDLRAKVRQSLDELERTVRIRKAFAVADVSHRDVLRRSPDRRAGSH